MFDNDVELVEKNYLKKLEEIAKKYDWVSVKDRLPEPNTVVLAHYADGRISTADYIDEHLKFITSSDITHWMPLPEPPKEDNAE